MKVGYVVRSFMTSNIASIETTAILNEVMHLMVDKNIGSELVTTDREMVGILTQRDLMRATLDVFRKLSDAWI